MLRSLSHTLAPTAILMGEADRPGHTLFLRRRRTCDVSLADGRQKLHSPQRFDADSGRNQQITPPAYPLLALDLQ
jgi:hypothetical protein